MRALRFGGYQPERSVHTRAVRALDAALRERLPGGNTQQGSAQQAVEGFPRRLGQPRTREAQAGGDPTSTAFRKNVGSRPVALTQPTTPSGLIDSHQAESALALDITAQITATGRAAADLLTMTESGELDLCYFASSYLAGRIPALGVLDLPFEGADRAAIWRRLDGEAGRLIKAAVARDSGYELLAFWDNGIRHISNGVRAIRHPRDCAGLSIRTLDNAFHQAIFRALGFAPRFIDVKDLGAAVASRTIDAQENPLTNLVNFDIHKTHRFVSLTGQFFGIALVLGNRAALGELDASQRAWLERSIAHATSIQRDLAAAEDEACLRLLEADGVDVVKEAQIDQAAFRARVADVVANEARHLDPALLAAWSAPGRVDG